MEKTNENKDLIHELIEHNGTKGLIPKSTFILFALPQTEWKKLEKWIAKSQRPNIFLGKNGQVVLLNDDRLRKYVTKKAQKLESTAPLG